MLICCSQVVQDGSEEFENCTRLSFVVTKIRLLQYEYHVRRVLLLQDMVLSGKVLLQRKDLFVDQKVHTLQVF